MAENGKASRIEGTSLTATLKTLLKWEKELLTDSGGVLLHNSPHIL
jgi:hypothetical protein